MDLNYAFKLILHIGLRRGPQWVKSQHWAKKKKTGKQHRQGILSALILLTRARNRFCQRTAQRSRSRNIYNRLRDQTLYVKNPNPFLHTHSLSNTGFTRAALPEV